MTRKMNGTIPLVELQCGTCGTFHAIPEAMHNAALEEGGYWTCPNGHSRGYREGRRERETVQRERDQYKQKVAQLEDDIVALKKSRAAVQGEYAKVKKRVSAGVCPCCNRSFENLRRHMHNKHPELATNVVSIKAAAKQEKEPPHARRIQHGTDRRFRGDH